VTLEEYKQDISHMPFLQRFVVALMKGDVPDLTLAVEYDAESPAAFHAHIAEQLYKWDRAVRLPFLGHMIALLTDRFSKSEPV
jgi:hypothetical protein